MELYVCQGYKSRVIKPELRSRINIRVKVGFDMFQGGLRTYPSKRGDVYVCPDLLSDGDGTKISLAKVLKEFGIEPKSEVSVRIDNGVWEIFGPLRRRI